MLFSPNTNVSVKVNEHTERDGESGLGGRGRRGQVRPSFSSWSNIYITE